LLSARKKRLQEKSRRSRTRSKGSFQAIISSRVLLNETFPIPYDIKMEEAEERGLLDEENTSASDSTDDDLMMPF